MVLAVNIKQTKPCSVYGEASAQTDFAGERCKWDLQMYPEKANTSACADINAGSFHVIVANMLGTAKLVGYERMNFALAYFTTQGFVGDRDRGVEVWNQPIYSFQTRLLGE